MTGPSPCDYVFAAAAVAGVPVSAMRGPLKTHAAARVRYAAVGLAVTEGGCGMAEVERAFGAPAGMVRTARRRYKAPEVAEHVPEIRRLAAVSAADRAGAGDVDAVLARLSAAIAAAEEERARLLRLTGRTP